MKLLLALTLLVVPALAQDGPVQNGDIYILTKEEAEKINSVLDDAAKMIRAQQKTIDRLKSATGCT